MEGAVFQVASQLRADTTVMWHCPTYVTLCGLDLAFLIHHCILQAIESEGENGLVMKV